MNYYSNRDLARGFRTVRKNTLMIANEIPDASYNFRATPDTRSVGELLAHIAASARWTHRVQAIDKLTSMSFEDFGRYAQENAAYEQSLKTKADIVKALESNADELGRWLENASDEVLSQVVTFPAPVEPPQKTRFEMLLSGKEHEMHHRAQLMLMQRMIGITPHLTRERQARAAAAARPAEAGAR
jgi:uncharacterized damage-inducible protein DinB